LEEIVAALINKTENMAAGIRRAYHETPLYPKKLALTSPTCGGLSVGTVRWRTQTTEFVFACLFIVLERGNLKKVQAKTVGSVLL
jgi:hypothetical protein